MPRHRWLRVPALLFALFVLACGGQAGVGGSAPSLAYPGNSWDSIPDARAAGWSPEVLDTVRARLSALPSTGFLAVVGGRVLFSYGDLDTVTYLASVRKSILSMLMGNYVRRGTIELGRTLADLGMDAGC